MANFLSSVQEYVRVYYGEGGPNMANMEEWSAVSVGAAVAMTGLLLLAFITFTRTTVRPRHRLPPGPRGWPIFGSILSLGTMPHEALYELSKRYGPLMFMRLGSVGTVVVSSAQVAEEVLKKYDQIMCSRPEMIVAQHVFYRGHDVAFTPYGQHWRYMRKVCTVGLLTATRISQFREIREKEVLAGLHFILEESQRGNAVNMDECFTTMAGNNITQMMMKKRVSSFQTSNSGSKLTSFGKTCRDLHILVGAFNIADFVPALKPFDPQGLLRQTKVVHKSSDKFLEEVIEEHRQGLSIATPENYKEDFVDALLRGFGQTKELQEKLSNDSIKGLLMDMLMAATDTSSTSSLWILTELIRRPKMMRRVQEELDSVVGPNRLVQEEDLPDLKYLHRVVLEGLRLHPVTPLMLPHESTHDCEIQGFHIPAKTRVVLNSWGIHRDPGAWENPSVFDPDRFLNSKVELKGQDFQFLPFGSGRRSCPGMNLGWLMAVYPLALLLHSLDWTLPEGQREEELDVSETFGLVLYKRFPLHAFGKARLPNHVIYPDEQVQK